jgi:hypothetical protein
MMKNRVFLDFVPFSYLGQNDPRNHSNRNLFVSSSCDFVDLLPGWQVSQSTTLPMLEFT